MNNSGCKTRIYCLHFQTALLYVEYRDDPQTVGTCLESQLPFLRGRQGDYCNWRSESCPGLVGPGAGLGWGKAAALSVSVVRRVGLVLSYRTKKGLRGKGGSFPSARRWNVYQGALWRGFTLLLFIFLGISWFGTEKKNNSGLSPYSYFLYSSCSHVPI